MVQTQTDPFFARSLPATLVNLATAALLTAVVLLDVLSTPFGGWIPGQPAPTTYRSTLDDRCAFDELLAPTKDSKQRENRFLVQRGQTLSLVVLEDLERQLPERKQIIPIQVAGIVVFLFLALTIYTLILRRTGQNLQLRFRAVGSQYGVLILCVLTARLLFDYTSLSAFSAPTALAVLLFSPLLRQPHALALHLMAVALVATMLPFTPGMVLAPVVTGWSVALMVRPGSGPVRLMLAAAAGAVIGSVALLGFSLFSSYPYDFSFSPQGDLAGLVLGMLVAGMLAVIFLYPVTLLFGGVPRSKLASLRDLEHPVLKDLAEKAPGTFQHTMAVANMAEKVANDIDADDALTRTGAYFHDIGKMREPVFFSENQQAENPHDQLSPEQSVKKLRGHVLDGVTIARGANLPERIVDFLIEHHGASTMDYFIDKASRAAGRQVDTKAYSYGGRNPTSRETAVLMIVDSVEAASHTLKEPDHKQLEKLVRQILFGKLNRGYLDDSGLTTRDLKRIGQSLVAYLEAQFHVRVEYPWQRDQAQVQAADASPRVATPMEGTPVAQTAEPRPPSIGPDALPGDGEKG